VQIALAGHTHMDDFRASIRRWHVPDRGFGLRRLYSPLFGEQPSLVYFAISCATGEISDIATYYLDLANGGADPKWALEYRFLRHMATTPFRPNPSVASGCHPFGPKCPPNFRALLRDFSPITHHRRQLGHCTPAQKPQFTSTDYGQLRAQPTESPGEERTTDCSHDIH